MTAARPRLVDHGAGYAGWNKRNRWRARVYLDGKHLSLGYYDTAEAARAAHAGQNYSGMKLIDAEPISIERVASHV